MTNKTTCPVCHRRFVLDAGAFPYHEQDGDECAGALLDEWAAALVASESMAGSDPADRLAMTRRANRDSAAL